MKTCMSRGIGLWGWVRSRYLVLDKKVSSREHQHDKFYQKLDSCRLQILYIFSLNNLHSLPLFGVTLSEGVEMKDEKCNKGDKW